MDSLCGYGKHMEVTKMIISRTDRNMQEIYYKPMDCMWCGEKLNIFNGDYGWTNGEEGLCQKCVNDSFSEEPYDPTIFRSECELCGRDLKEDGSMPYLDLEWNDRYICSDCLNKKGAKASWLPMRPVNRKIAVG